MKEYLKMEDAFSRKVDPITDWDEHGHEVKWITLLSHQAEHAAHAINSHDELVAEVERLRDALQDAYLDGCHYGWEMSAEGYNAEHGGPNDGRLHNQFIESYSGEPYISE